MEATHLVTELERVVVGAVGLTTRALAEAAPGADLTFPQWRALLILGEDDGGARVGQIAARVGVTLPATSRLLRRLAQRGLVTLTPDETDRRATRARLTENGAAIRGSILDFRRQALHAVAKRIVEHDEPAARAMVVGLADALADFS